METINCSKCGRVGKWETMKKTCYQGKHKKGKKGKMPDCLRRPLPHNYNGQIVYATVQEWYHLQSGNPLAGIIITEEFLIARKNGITEKAA